MGLEKLNAIRKEKGLSLDELSQKSGVPLGTLSKISAGITKDPKLETVKSIAQALECTLDDFNDKPITQNTTTLTTNQNNLLKEFNKLNSIGQVKAIERIEELTHVERYKDNLPLSVTFEQSLPPNKSKKIITLGDTEKK